MSDIGSGTHDINLADLEYQIAQHMMTIKAQNLRKAQLSSEYQKLNESQEASKLSLLNLQERLDKMNQSQS